MRRVVTGLAERGEPVEGHAAAFGERDQVVYVELVSSAALDAAVAVTGERSGAKGAPLAGAPTLPCT